MWEAPLPASNGMNITLIGMPGAGKSFVGRRLADRLGMEFLDVDRQLIEPTHGKPLQEILDELGPEKFMTVESQAIIVGTIGRSEQVISPGGSAVYKKETMDHLKDISTVIYLQVPFFTLEARLGNIPRGIVGLGEKLLKQLYDERTPLYEKYADLTIECEGKNTEQIVAEIADYLEGGRKK